MCSSDLGRGERRIALGDHAATRVPGVRLPTPGHVGHVDLRHGVQVLEQLRRGAREQDQQALRERVEGAAVAPGEVGSPPRVEDLPAREADRLVDEVEAGAELQAMPRRANRGATSSAQVRANKAAYSACSRSPHARSSSVSAGASGGAA